MNEIRLFADIFHDVDLAAVRPRHLVDVCAEHPERWPDSLSPRNLDSGLESSIRLRKFPRGLQARRSVVAHHSLGAGVLLLENFDNEVAILLVGIPRAVRVVLQFVVAPT